jgi:hypothetical protein
MGNVTALFFNILTGTDRQAEKHNLERSLEIFKKTHQKNGYVW